MAGIRLLGVLVARAPAAMMVGWLGCRTLTACITPIDPSLIVEASTCVPSILGPPRTKLVSG